MPTLACETPMLRWQDMPMPDANAPVRLAVLSSVAPRHFWALVVFPPAWQRVRPGHYSVDEDFLLLQGDLTINGIPWHAHEHGFVPAHTLREQTESQRGCVACARFHGRPQWHAGRSALAPTGSVRHSPDWHSTAPTDLRGHGWAHPVFEHAGMAHGVVPHATVTAMRENGVPMDAFDLSASPGAHGAQPAQGTDARYFWARWPSLF